MADIDPIWWILLAVLLLALVGWLLWSRQRKLNAARAEAARIRERAAEGEGYVASAEERARAIQEQARAARAEADRLEQRAEEATRVARDHRDRVTDEYLHADDVDPDVRS